MFSQIYFECLTISFPLIIYLPLHFRSALDIWYCICTGFELKCYWHRIYTIIPIDFGLGNVNLSEIYTFARPPPPPPLALILFSFYLGLSEFNHIYIILLFLKSLIEISYLRKDKAIERNIFWENNIFLLI